MSSPPPASETLRTFAAIALPARVKDALGETQNRLRPKCGGARWIGPGGIHLTLKFLGDTRREQLDAVCGALGRAASARGAFNVSVRGVGVFPNPKRARVLWVGVAEGREELRALAAAIEENIEGLGFPRESRPFSPHLTLARFKAPAGIGRDVLEDAGECGSFEAAEITLFQSILRPAGAEYVALERFAFTTLPSPIARCSGRPGA